MQTAILAAALALVHGRHAAERGAHAHKHSSHEAHARFAREAIGEDGELSDSVIAELVSSYGFMVPEFKEQADAGEAYTSESRLARTHVASQVIAFHKEAGLNGNCNLHLSFQPSSDFVYIYFFFLRKEHTRCQYKRQCAPGPASCLLLLLLLLLLSVPFLSYRCFWENGYS